MGRESQLRTGRTVAALLIVALLAACGSKHHTAGSTSSSSGHGLPTIAVALTDHGLTFSPDDVAAADYLVSFTDHRAHPTTGTKVAVAFGPPGPLISGDPVPLGSTQVVTLWGDMIPWLVIDGVSCVRYLPNPKPADCALQRPEDTLYVSTSAQYPTPAT